MWLPSVISLLLLLGGAQAANILCYFSAPSLSHQITFHPIIRELAKHGHNLTVITPNPIRDASLPNLYEIDVEEISYFSWNKYNISSLGVNGPADLMPMIHAYMEIVEAQLSHLKVKELINNSKNYQFDLFITEHPHAFTVPFKKIFNITSMIGLSSLPLHMSGNKWSGNFEHSTLFPDLNLPYANKLSFFEKVHSFIHSTFGMMMYGKIKVILFDILAKHYGRDLVNEIDDIAYSFDLVMVNYNPILHSPRPNVPAVIEFNGIHIRPPKELPKDIKSFLDSATDGAVYISFGSNIKSSAFPVEKRDMILKVISELPYKFIWKFEADLDNLPKNVILMKWAPQQDILRHPNMKLFVMQGGLQSLDEAMYTKTPILAIPFFGDQLGNAAKVEERGLGRRLTFATLTKDSFKSTIEEIINDDKYKLRLEEVHDILTDQPMSAVDKTVWWIEYVLRHKGAGHMRSPTVNVPFIEYYMIDVIGFLLGVVLLKLFFIYIGVKLMIKLAKKWLFGRGDNEKKLKKN